MAHAHKLDDGIFRILEQVERGELNLLAPAQVFNKLLPLQTQSVIALIGEDWALTSRGLDMLEQWRANKAP